MIHLLVAATIAAGAVQASGPPMEPRKTFNACLNKFMKANVEKELDDAGFTTGAKAACAAEEAAFRKSLVDFDIKMKIKRAEAEENASLQVDDYMLNTIETYKGLVSDGKKTG